MSTGFYWTVNSNISLFLRFLSLVSSFAMSRSEENKSLKTYDRLQAIFYCWQNYFRSPFCVVFVSIINHPLGFKYTFFSGSSSKGLKGRNEMFIFIFRSFLAKRHSINSSKLVFYKIITRRKATERRQTMCKKTGSVRKFMSPLGRFSNLFQGFWRKSINWEGCRAIKLAKCGKAFFFRQFLSFCGNVCDRNFGNWMIRFLGFSSSLRIISYVHGKIDCAKLFRLYLNFLKLWISKQDLQIGSPNNST